MALTIITADQRLAERKGVKALIVGPPGVGKTSLLRTLDPQTTLFMDLEAGAMSVADIEVDEVRPKTWPECRDLACFFAGPDENLDAKSTYGTEHYQRVVEQFGDVKALDKYETLFIDSLSVAGRMCFQWAEHQDSSFTKKGEKDLLGTYGLLKREMVGWVTRLQQARTSNVVMISLLSEKEDDFKRKTWALQIDGKASAEIPGIPDVVMTLTIMHPAPEDADQTPFRALVTDVANEWGYPAKYRSTEAIRLDPLEAPDLGKLFEKLTPKTTRGGSARNLTPRAAA